MPSDKEKISINELEMAKKRDHKIMITDEATCCAERAAPCCLQHVCIRTCARLFIDICVRKDMGHKYVS